MAVQKSKRSKIKNNFKKTFYKILKYNIKKVYL